MSERESRNKIMNIIIDIEKPFSKNELFRVCKENNIENKSLILEVLDILCEIGIVSYSEIEEDLWAYAPCA